MHKIFDAHDMAVMEGFKDGYDRLKRLPFIGGQKSPRYPVWSGKVCAGPPVWARIERGRWIADCDAVIEGHKCGGAEWVAPDVPFFCFSCGNATTKGQARPVIFPKNKDEIEAAMMERLMVDMIPGAHPIVRALSARPALAVEVSGEKFAIMRDWNPGEKPEQLRAQHKFVAEMVKQMKDMTGGQNGI
jgi:hypothetical protein